MLHLIRLLPQSNVCHQPRVYSHPSHFPPRSFSLHLHFITPYFILLSSIRISSIPPSRLHSLPIWNQTSKANRRAPISVYLHHFSIVEYLGFCDHDLYSWAFSKKKTLQHFAEPIILPHLEDFQFRPFPSSAILPVCNSNALFRFSQMDNV